MQKQKYRVVVVMPCFKEEDVIVDFLTEVNHSFLDYETSILVVDDNSPDSTVELIENLAEDLERIIVLPQMRNRGHGPSTLIALKAGLELTPDVIVATDGDGQISGEDLRKLCDSVLHGKFSYAEGIRIFREDPWFRLAVSALTRTLMRVRTRKMIRDANTPFRAYQPQQLRQVLAFIPSDSLIPNLLISALARQMSWDIQEIQVVSLLRRGNSNLGSSWNQKSQFLPSSRFVRFCMKAARQWFIIALSDKHGGR